MNKALNNEGSVSKHGFFHRVFVEWFWETVCVKNIYGKFDKWKGWLYLSPALVLLIIFTAYPIFNTVLMSVLEGYDMRNPWVSEYTFGFQNFEDVLMNKASGFVSAISITVLLCVLTVPISTMLALLIAVALNSIKPLQRFLQTIFFLPYVTNSIAIGMVFAAMFSVSTSGESIGFVNSVLGVFHISPVDWLGMDARWANIFVLVFYIVWNALPFKILILLGGLQGINKQYYEAAKVDGTSRARTFWRITVPLLSPMLAYVIITSFIGGFKEYSSIVGIFGENMGPTGSLTKTYDTMVGFIYTSLDAHKEGRASAAALILFAIIFAVTMVNLYVSKKKTHY